MVKLNATQSNSTDLKDETSNSTSDKANSTSEDISNSTSNETTSKSNSSEGAENQVATKKASE